MLSRVAGSLYWLGRYLERAENVTRLLLVASELSVEFEGIDETLAQAEWDDVVAALPGSELGDDELEPSPRQGLVACYVGSLLLDDGNALSVRHSLRRARENARSVREALTREVFSQLNETYRELSGGARARIAGPVHALETVGETHRSIMTTLGAIEHNLSRDQGWVFLKLGEAVERTQRTLLVLRAKLPSLRAADAGLDLPIFYARWRGLLRCVASLENFRRAHGAGLDPDSVCRFLLLDPSTPRSVLCGVARIHGYLEQLPPPEGPHTAHRLAGRLLATLRYEGDEILGKPELDEFCDRSLATLHDLHGAVERQYFPL